MEGTAGLNADEPQIYFVHIPDHSERHPAIGRRVHVNIGAEHGQRFQTRYTIELTPGRISLTFMKRRTEMNNTVVGMTPP